MLVVDLLSFWPLTKSSCCLYSCIVAVATNQTRTHTLSYCMCETLSDQFLKRLVLQKTRQMTYVPLAKLVKSHVCPLLHCSLVIFTHPPILSEIRYHCALLRWERDSSRFQYFPHFSLVLRAYMGPTPLGVHCFFFIRSRVYFFPTFYPSWPPQ